VSALIVAPAVAGVERIGPPSPEEFRHYVAARRPVIIVGAMEDWPARTLWSADYLLAHFGERRIPVAGVADGRVINDPASGIPYRDEPLAACVERLRGGGANDGYVMVLLAEALCELERDLRAPAFAPPAPWAIRKFWLSAPDTRSPLHMDLPENLFAQFVGRKRVTLFAPRHEWRMYRHAPWSRLPQVSRVDAEAPDLERFPRFGGARGLRCIVEPGEILYIPRFWWHQVRSLEFAISVNYWWATGWAWGIVRTALAYQRLRKLRF